MDLLAKYFHSTVYQAPDAAAVAAADPAPPAPPADPGAGDPPPADPGASDPPAPSSEAKPAVAPWFMKRISDESARRTAAEERAAAAERKVREQNEMLARLQAKPGEPLSPAPVREPNPQDFEEAVRAESFKRDFARDTGDVRAAGLAKFPDFQQTLGVLDALGVTTNQVILDLLSADKANAHTILDHLAKNPEKAAAITAMDQGRRIAEFVRMAPLTATPVKGDAPPAAPAKVSRAPNPPPPVDPGASQTVDWRSDKATDEQFDAGFKEMMAKRHARR